MEEQNAAVVELTRKQRSDRHFLLSRLESAFSKIGAVERRQKSLEEEVQNLTEKLREEANAAESLKQAHASEIAQLHSHMQQVEARMSHYESMLSSQRPSAFSQAAQNPNRQDDPFNVDYLARPMPLATESSFAFGMPEQPGNHQNNTPNLHQQPTTTWDLLNFGDDLPQMADTIRQSFIEKQQAQPSSSPRSWQGRGNTALLDTSQSEPCATTATDESMADSDNALHPDHIDHPRQPNTSRVMSTASLNVMDPGLETNQGDHTSHPENPRVMSTTSLRALDSGGGANGGYLEQGLGISHGYPEITPPEVAAHPVPPESYGYPSVFEPLGSAQAAPSAPPDPLPRFTTAFSAQLQRRDASIRSQKVRFEHMCELEARNVEQEIVRPNVFEALSKAGEMFKTAEQLMREADAADQEAGQLNHENQAEDRSEAQRGADIRANKLRNALETSYSRLCSALDYATQRQNILVHEQKPQRSSSTAMKNLKALLGRKEPEPELEDNSREPTARPGLNRNSTASSTGKPVPDAAYTSPLVTAVDRMRKETTHSPQRAARPPAANKAPAHRRALSDTVQFPSTPDLNAAAQASDRGGSERSQSAKTLATHKSEAELVALINELEQRRLALYF